jgi:hypothetical protein
MAETEILTPKESAAYRRCSERKQDRERAEGRGPPFVRIDGRIFYRRSDEAEAKHEVPRKHTSNSREVVA